MEWHISSTFYHIAQRCVLPVSFPVDFITAIVVNPPERKLAQCTSVHFMISVHLCTTWLSDLYKTENCVFCWYASTAEKLKFDFFSITEPCNTIWSRRFKSRMVIILYVVPLPPYYFGKDIFNAVMCNHRNSIYMPIPNRVFWAQISLKRGEQNGSFITFINFATLQWIESWTFF